jgi:hypothetical protein
MACVRWLPHHQSWCCWDDPRCGEFDPGRGCICPWECVIDEVLVVGECLHLTAAEIQCDLEEQGIGARVIRPNDVMLTSRDLFATRMGNVTHTPIVIIGCGESVDDAVRLCRALQSIHIGVDKLILVDNRCCERVPDNVASFVNIYYQQGGYRLCDGKAAFREGRCTQVANYDLVKSGDDREWFGAGPRARQLVVEQVLESVRPASN